MKKLLEHYLEKFYVTFSVGFKQLNQNLQSIDLEIRTQNRLLQITNQHLEKTSGYIPKGKRKRLR